MYEIQCSFCEGIYYLPLHYSILLSIIKQISGHFPTFPSNSIMDLRRRKAVMRDEQLFKIKSRQME